MQISIQEGTSKTVINSLKTIRKNIDESLKYFCGDSGISHSGYTKRFFPQGQRNIFAIENQVAPYAIIVFKYDLLIANKYERIT